MRVVVASAHRHPDLARLWFRSVARDLVPALRSARADVDVVLFRDATPDAFDPLHFPGATLLAPAPGMRDFIEFYDAALRRPADVLLLLDADLFILDGGWAASHLAAFDDPSVAAVSLLRRTDQPGVYALFARTEAYRALPAPVFAPADEDLDAWPRTLNRQPGDRAAIRLRASGKTIRDVPAREAEPRISDFHGTTVIRVSREIFGALLGPRFDALLSEKPYFAMGAYDNILLGTLYRALFGMPFAAGADGVHLSGSATLEVLRQALLRVENLTALSRLVAAFDRSNGAFARLAAHEGLALEPPAVLPAHRLLVARAWGAARRMLRRPGA